MSDIKFSLPGADIITLSGSTADKLIRVGNGDAALLYLYILKTKGLNSSVQATEDLGKTRGDIADAMAVLSRLGLICITDDFATPLHPRHADNGAATHNQPRQYIASEIAREKEKNPDFSALVEETQRSLGKLLSGDELERLMGIYDGLRLPPEVILLLFTHCISESRGRGGGRMPSMRYIEKAAYTWEGEGLFTLERAEEYLKALEERKSARGKIKSALKIYDREFSESEKKYVDQWITMGFESEAVEIAYDITALQTGKRAWSYMNKIMHSWHESGLHTAEQIHERENKRSGTPASNKSAKTAKSAYSADKFGSVGSKDRDRMRQLLKKIKEE